jgi:hypothetical protein
MGQEIAIKYEDFLPFETVIGQELSFDWLSVIPVPSVVTWKLTLMLRVSKFGIEYGLMIVNTLRNFQALKLNLEEFCGLNYSSVSMTT